MTRSLPFASTIAAATSAIALLACAATAFAQGARLPDGAVEITQAKALAGGIDVNDAPGFPVTIVTPGRYVLGSDLYVPAGSQVIWAKVPDVVIDLNGFTIRSEGRCSWTAPRTAACTAMSPYGHFGITASSRLTVRNGTIRGFSGCLVAGMDPRIQNVKFQDCNVALDAIGGLIENVNIKLSRTGIQTTHSIIYQPVMNQVAFAINANRAAVHRAHITDAGSGITALEQAVFHESSIWAVDGANLGAIVTLGNNLCQGYTC